MNLVFLFFLNYNQNVTRAEFKCEYTPYPRSITFLFSNYSILKIEFLNYEILS